MDTKEAQIYRAKLAEQAERYDDMVTAMSAVANTATGDLTDEERNLLSVAYKNVVGARRSAWRIIKSLEQKEEKAKDEDKRVLAENYRKTVETELTEKCQEVLGLIDTLFNLAEKTEPKVFYLKMKGDYYRYLVEIHQSEVPGEKSKEYKELEDKSREAYKNAQTQAKELPSTHPIKLGLALNFSVFYYEIAGNPKEACKLAEEAFDDAISELDSVQEDSYKDSTLIMQLLRDNLTLWKQEPEEPEDQGGD